MKINNIITETNIAPQILKDPKLTKMLAIAMKHDNTLDINTIPMLGPKVDDTTIVNLWGKIVDESLSNTNYGNISTINKFEMWLLKLYINGVVTYEDINGEGGDTLGAWYSLSIRGLLQPADQDFNRFKSLGQLQRALQKYRNELSKIKDQALIEKHKRERKEIVLIDNDRFLVIIPLNYGSCYTFNNQLGVPANFCTGGSSGLTWFNSYADNGPLVSVLDKNNPNNVDGKWQFHAPSNQIVNAIQDRRYDYKGNALKFKKLFPGLMEEIVKAIQANSADIHELSKPLLKNKQGYDVNSQIENIKSTFSDAFMTDNDRQNQQGNLVEQNLTKEGKLIPFPKGTVKVDVSDVYDWYKLGQHISNLKGLGKHDFGKGPPQTVMAFGSEPLEHKYLKYLNQIGLKTHDIDEDIKKKNIDIKENFADGRNPQDKGDSKRLGIPKKASLATLDKIVKSKTASPRKKQLAHWQANMRRGKKK